MRSPFPSFVQLAIPLVALVASSSFVACKEKQVIAAQDGAMGAGAVREVGPKTVKFDPKALDRLGIKVDAVGRHAATLDLEVPG